MTLSKPRLETQHSHEQFKVKRTSVSFTVDPDPVFEEGDEDLESSSVDSQSVLVCPALSTDTDRPNVDRPRGTLGAMSPSDVNQISAIYLPEPTKEYTDKNKSICNR